MIREDRELLTELARVNREIAPLAMRIMEGSAGAAEQQHYGQRLISAGNGYVAERMRPAGSLSPGKLSSKSSSLYPRIQLSRAGNRERP